MMGGPPFVVTYAIKTDGTERHLVGFSGSSLGIVNTKDGELIARSIPSESGKIVGVLENDTELAIKGETDGFYAIGVWWGEDAFVSADGVDLVGETK